MVRVEVLREVLGACLLHVLLENAQVLTVRHLTLFELPVKAAGGERSLYHVIVVVDGQELVDHTLIVRCVCVVQRLDH